jgi:fumarate reductase (CoM/CoB) subunit A
VSAITYGFTLHHRKTDILIIGAGGAGARAALEAAQTGRSVTLICRSPLGQGGLTPTANGGYQAAVLPGDSPAIHAEDLIAAGCGLNDRPLVGVLTGEALEQARMLEKFGATMNWEIPQKVHEPQMRYPRSIFVPGKEILATFRRQLKNYRNVLLLEDYLSLQLLFHDGAVVGALLFDIKEGTVTVCESKATILATGSLGEIYPLSAQEPMGIPTGSTGSGYVLAGMAGADLVDMEMIQFSIVPLVPPLIQGMRCLPWGPLRNARGDSFLPPGAAEYSHETARALYRELRQGPVTMDLQDRKAPDHARHPVAGQRNRQLREFEVTPYQRRVAVGLASLFMMGGVHINERCETSVPGLYAAGEVAANVHGARRVAGNAFTEMIVFGARAGKYAARAAEGKGSFPGVPKQQIEECLERLSGIVEGKQRDIAPGELRRKTRAIMGEYAHVIRNGPGLETALEKLGALEKDLPFVRVRTEGGFGYNASLIETFDLTWLLAVSRIVCHAALIRQESRGFQFREDFPEEKKDWLMHTLVRRAGGEWVGGTKAVAQ